MSEILNDVNASQENVVDSPSEQVTNNEPVNAGEKEVAQPTEKPVQTPEENAKFAEMRRAREAAEARAAKVEKDYSIAQKYGREYGVFSEDDIAANYSHLGITTFEQFEQAVERQKMIDRGIDPDILASEIENHPEVKKAKEKESQARNFGEFESWYTENVGKMPDLDKLPQPVIDAFFRGESMKTAFMEWDYKNFRERQQATETNKKNAASTTGSLTGNGANGADLISFETFEANKHDQNWVNKNYKKIMESRANW